jgi:acyl-CoA hydrolase
MHIAVDVYSRDPKVSELTQTTHCIIVFVAIDEEGRKIPVPHWEPQTEEERRMESYALRLMELRKAIEDEMKPFLST